MTAPAIRAQSPGLLQASDLPVPARVVLAILSLLLAASVIQPYYWPASHGLDITGNQIGRDFINTWAGPQLAFAGRAADLYNLELYQKAIGQLFGAPLNPHNFSYPPHGAILFWPFAQFPYGVALTLWLLTTFAALAAAMLSQLPRKDYAWALVLLVISPAVVINTLSGQNGCLSGALLLGGLLLMDRRPLLAGVMFGLLTYKPHLGLILVTILLARGAWRTIAAAGITTVGLVALSVVLFGPDPWHLFATKTSAVQLFLLQAWSGFYVIMMPTWFAALRSLGASYEAAMSVQFVLSLAVIASTAWAVRQTNDPAWHGLIAAAATPLALPYAFNYDLPALAVACAWIMLGRIQVDNLPRWLIGLAWFAPLLSMQFALRDLPIAQIGLLGFYVYVMVHLAKTTQPKSQQQHRPTAAKSAAFSVTAPSTP